LTRDFKEKNAGIVNYIANRRGKFYVLTPMLSWDEQGYHDGDIDLKQANVVLAEIHAKIAAEKLAQPSASDLRKPGAIEPMPNSQVELRI
jgi:hypothetical protein